MAVARRKILFSYLKNRPLPDVLEAAKVVARWQSLTQMWTELHALTPETPTEAVEAAARTFYGRADLFREWCGLGVLTAGLDRFAGMGVNQ